MLAVERSGFYAWAKRKAGKRKIANEALDKEIIAIFNNHKGRYGYPRITKELWSHSQGCSRNRIARRMKNLGLKANGKKRFKVTTDSKHNLPVAANLLLELKPQIYSNLKKVVILDVSSKPNIASKPTL